MEPTNERNKAITDHIPYVAAIANNASKPNTTQNDDYLSVAFEALVNAVDKYDETKGMGLKTYIGTEVRHRIKDLIRGPNGRFGQIKEGTLKTISSTLFRLHRKNAIYNMERLDDHLNSLETSTNGTRQKVINKDLTNKTLKFIKTLKLNPDPRRKADYPKVFELHFFKGLTLKEAAETQNIHESSASRVINHTILPKIREHLEVT